MWTWGQQLPTKSLFQAAKLCVIEVCSSLFIFITPRGAGDRAKILIARQQLVERCASPLPQLEFTTNSIQLLP